MSEAAADFNWDTETSNSTNINEPIVEDISEQEKQNLQRLVEKLGF